MADFKTKYGTTGVAITCTIDSLTDTSLRQSTAVDNSGNLYLDAVVAVTVVTAGSGTSATGYVAVYLATSANGSTYSGGASGTDDAYTGRSQNLTFLGTISAVANSTTYRASFSVRSAFGVVPTKWAIIVENQTGATLAGSGNSAIYQGYQEQSV